MPDAAARQAVEALKTRLDTVSGLSVFLDRSELEPLHESHDAWPAALIYVTDWRWDNPETGEGGLLHTVEFTIDVQSGGTDVAIIDLDCMNAVADINDAIAADYSLGGLLQTCDLTGASGLSDNDALVGASEIRGEMTFWTARDDFKTIVSG